MERKWLFNWTAPTHIKGLPISAKKAFKLLQRSWNDPTKDRLEVTWDFVTFYRRIDLPFEAKKVVEQVLSKADTPELKAICYVKLGQIMEQVFDFDAAIDFYAQALDIEEPYDSSVLYFANNNLGYSLNQLGRYKEAENFCRDAIAVDPKRHNAHKNLAVSLEGQGRFVEAVYAYIAAVRSNAADPRAFKHLEEMVSKRPEIYHAISDLDYQIKKCKEAVTYVRLLHEERQ